MSSDRLSDAPSRAADPGRAAVVAALGAALIDALEQHLPGAREHAEATAAYAFAIAAELAWPRERAELVREAAKLHDVGMVYVPAATLRKPDAERDDADRALLGSHIEAGCQPRPRGRDPRRRLRLDPGDARALGRRRAGGSSRLGDPRARRG